MKTAAKIFALNLAVFVSAGALAYESTAQVIKRQALKGIANVFYECVEKAESGNTAFAAGQSAQRKDKTHD